jgi:predicted GIY-YIG superfamily endonuclease
MRLGAPLTYLVHLNQRYMHAGHYTGTTRDLAARLADHASGRGARLLEVVSEAGIEWQLAQVWPGGRDRERQLKRQGGASRRCPVCKGQPPDVAAWAESIAARRRPESPAPPVAEPEPEPLWESVSAYLTGDEAAVLLAELEAAEDTAWQQAAAEAGQPRSAALEMACDLSRLRSAEASAVERLAEARALAQREGWAEADLDLEPEPELEAI